MSIQSLRDLYRRMTGKSFPENITPPNTPTAFVDKAKDIGAGAPPAGMVHVGLGGTDDAPIALPESQMRTWMQTVHRCFICERAFGDMDGSEVDFRDVGGQAIPTIGGQQTEWPVHRTKGGSWYNEGNLKIHPVVTEKGRQQIRTDVDYMKHCFSTQGIEKLANAKRILFAPVDGGSYDQLLKTFDKAAANGNDVAFRAVAGHYTTVEGKNRLGPDIIQIDPFFGWYAYGGTYRHVLVHEFGHRFHYGCSDGLRKKSEFNVQVWAWYSYAKESDESLFPTSYSASAFYEFWAECFAFYMSGKLASRPELQTWVGSMIQTFKTDCTVLR